MSSKVVTHRDGGHTHVHEAKQNRILAFLLLSFGLSFTEDDKGKKAAKGAGWRSQNEEDG